MTTNNNLSKKDRLQELGGSNFEIATGQPDIRGWDVKGADGKSIGEVDELIFDTESLKVRYIVIDLESNLSDVNSKDVLVPIGLAELDGADDDVLLPGVTTEILNTLPAYEKGNITDDVEMGVRNAFLGLGASAAAGAAISGNDAGFYDHDHFNENNLYQKRNKSSEDIAIPIIEENLEVGKKAVQTGGVRVQTRIVEQPVEEKVHLKEEHVSVERETVNRPATEKDFNNLNETVIELTENAEVPVVAKQARVVEEISFGKEVDEHNETIRDTVRHTEIDIENIEKDSKK